MNKGTSTIDFLLKEMFKRVGVEYNKNIVKEDGWYLRYTWSEEDQEDFKDFMVNHLCKSLNYNKVFAEKEADMFLLNYGWKFKEKVKQ